MWESPKYHIYVFGSACWIMLKKVFTNSYCFIKKNPHTDKTCITPHRKICTPLTKSTDILSVTFIHVNMREKWQSRMENHEIQASKWKSHTTKTKKHNRKLKNWARQQHLVWTHVIVKGRNFLLLTWYPTCY